MKDLKDLAPMIENSSTKVVKDGDKVFLVFENGEKLPLEGNPWLIIGQEEVIEKVCSFCKKPQHEVEVLLGDEDATICNACVESAVELLTKNGYDVKLKITKED